MVDRTVFKNRQKKVAFNIASEASYAYILSGPKITKNAKSEFLKTQMRLFGWFLNTVRPQ